MVNFQERERRQNICICIKYLLILFMSTLGTKQNISLKFSIFANIQSSVNVELSRIILKSGQTSVFKMAR